MNVVELIESLQKMPPGLKVVRADIEAGAITVTRVETADLYEQGPGEERYWQNYYPEIDRDPGETPNERLVVIG